MSSAPKMNERVRRLSICCNNPKVNGKCIKYTLHQIFGSVSSRQIHLSFVFHTSNFKGSKNQSFLHSFCIRLAHSMAEKLAQLESEQKMAQMYLNYCMF